MLNFKLTLTITCVIGFLFSMGMFLFPEFVTKEQFANAEGQGLADLVTLRYAIASLILALVVITFHLRSVEGDVIQGHIMRGYWMGFSIVCVTNLVLQISGKISAVPPIIGTGIIAIISLMAWLNLSKKSIGKDD